MTLLPEITCRVLSYGAHPGPRNMAMDATAAETVSDGGPASVRVYDWCPSTLSLGYAQDIETIDREFVRRNGLDLTRRPTGGGAIYHDRFGDISYSIVVPRHSLPESLTDAYRLLCQPVLDALDEIGVNAGFASEKRPPLHEPACYLRDVHPAHDITVSTEEGDRKISGNAQHRQRDAIVQHGSITFGTRPERHAQCFPDPSVTADAFIKRTIGISDRVSIGRAEAVDILERSLVAAFDASPGEWSASERERIDDLVEQRFGNQDWIHRGEETTAEGS